MEQEIRDQRTDHLLTPANCMLAIIDYQPVMINAVNTMDRSKLITNVTLLAKLARQFGVLVVVSTVNASSDENNRLIPALRAELCGIEPIDRTYINAWEDDNFRSAVKEGGRLKVIIAGLWTEACVALPALDMLEDGYDVYPVVDAMGGTTCVAHQTALERMQQAGARLTSLVQVACELQRDWGREGTAEGLVGILREAGVFPRMD